MNSKILSFILLSSCSSINFPGSSSADLTFHYTGDERGFKLAISAAKEWKDICNKNIEITKDKGIPLKEVKDLHAEVPNAPKNSSAITGFRNNDLKQKPFVVMFEPYGTDEQIKAIISHELGHSLGIPYHS